ncbi:MAG TPA: hypothetical protein VKV21_05205 [Solirubrobacteraceae bacterium]|nr:hypothetical protein [Solirubrobacteraceae bacterium]
MPNDWSLIYGRPAPPPRLPSLVAGELSANVAGGDAVGVAHRGRELLHIVGVRVRDAAWGTIPCRLEELQVERGARGTVARTRARYEGAGIACSCAIAIALSADSLEYEMDALAESAFEYARIGIVAIHPSTLTAGRPFRAHGRRGSTEGLLPTLVGPQRVVEGETKPLFDAFEHLEIDVEPGLTLAFELQGDEFEMEDQRNWTDGSFKTYSTPVGTPLPQHVHSGARWHQRLRLEVRATAATTSLRAPARGSGRQGVVVETGTAESAMPPLGTTWRPASPGDTSPAASLAPGVLRVELQSEPTLALAASTAAAAVGAELELALRLPQADAVVRRWLAALAEAIAGENAVPVRVAPIREGDSVTTPQTVRLIRESLPGVAVLAGSADNLAELNRDPPPAGAPLDGLFFAANPQMHDTDDRSVMLSLKGQRDAARTARTLSGGHLVHVSPITLLPAAAPHADVRQHTLFAAAWLAGSAAALIEAGVASASWFELSGPRGLVGEHGELSPAFHVLRELCAWRGRRRLTVTVTDPETCAGLATDHDGELRLMLANLTADPVTLDVDGIDRGATIGLLGPATAAQAEPFAASERSAAGGAPGVRVELGPYEVARLRAL